jgi:hypothetical protein
VIKECFKLLFNKGKKIAPELKRKAKNDPASKLEVVSVLIDPQN